MPVMPVSVIHYAGRSWRPMICHIPSVCHTFSVAGITVACRCSSEIRQACRLFTAAEHFWRSSSLRWHWQVRQHTRHRCITQGITQGRPSTDRQTDRQTEPSVTAQKDGCHQATMSWSVQLHCVPKKHVTTLSRMTWTISVRLQ